MKIIISFIVLFFSFTSVHSHGIRIDSGDDTPKKYDLLLLSFGAGTIKAFSSSSDRNLMKYRFFGTVNGSIHVYQSFYLTAGIDGYTEPIYGQDWITNLNLLSSFFVDIYKKKISLLLGMGGFIRFGALNGSGDPPYPGYALSLRAQYNLVNKLSYGIELKHIGYMFQPPVSILVGNLYISVGLN